MISPTFLDFETRSRAKLKLIGGRNYCADPSTEVVCAVLRYPDGSEDHHSPHLPAAWCNRREESVTYRGRGWQPKRPEYLCAHNGINFDRHVWRLLGWPEPKAWVDTSHLARVAGMPQASLEWLAQHLLGRPKDLEGNKLTLKLSRVSTAAKTRGQLPTITLDILERVLSYCALDVELMAELWREWLGEWYGMDLDGYEAAQIAMNDRGMRFDSELARTLLEALDILATRACAAADIPRAWGTNPGLLVTEFTRRGCPIDSCAKEVLEEVDLWMRDPVRVAEYERSLPGFDRAGILALIQARQACASIAGGKLRAGLARVSADHRLRDGEKYYGAHTGRESGQGLQPHNLTKGPALDFLATIKLFDRGELKAVHLVE